ncbi:glucose 1-dehydrogenase [Sphingobium sp. Sx8-8]|uniref:glucose 1-dehydrogenase n=1 Tax=Sphingobium sp. Sx8-8 TaxID=2933617 RepID=UPI001F5A7222|nr:glucose 1-dehydrogenase [Sphingobium sp. Sx8-8]
MPLFEGKVALVTGGATGIGRETALRYAAEGARVTVADINEDEGQKTVGMIEAAGGQALFIRTDVTSSTDVEAMVARTMNRFGRLDAAFNNAGTPGGFTNVVDCTQAEWDRTIALNLTSVWLCMKHEIPAMLASGGGAIVNTASEAANHPSPHMATYIATKSGVVGLTRSAALDFAGQNIRVNALLPGPTVTPMLMQGTQGLERSLEAFGAGLPMGRVGQPREQADVVIFLTSEMSSFVTGMAVSVDGGLNLR